ncbi:HlyD family secretion protein [Nitrospirillum amazonense]|uniref:Membrane fusion protein (Multidrug efflux system) n=1 Tax=Nitrospirillum amazonense TaxID=28077 RepID=A0A560KI17_9PROT|nr:HlyD family secretion protein [Nitrospirillum amazonense]MDG3444482.1 HlyD family secretion protein [Nitrospirillum amazonense]TWB82913.1 membrane fusion protein (multidrug efflux system) [Nitrospirillum amazonense]
MSTPSRTPAAEAAEPSSVHVLAPAARKPSPRRHLFAGLGAVVLLAGLGYGGYRLVTGGRYVSTDNAYVNADAAQVTSSVDGTVRAVPVVDTQSVKKGDVLVLIDDTDARIALAQAQAQLGQAERRVRGYFANDGALAAQVAARDADAARAEAQLTSAQADYDRARVDLDRRRALAASGAVSGEELTSAQNAFATATANLAVAKAARAQAAANRAAAQGSQKVNTVLIADSDVATNPEVMAARARVEQAQVDLGRTTVRAPFDGVVARRQVQVGQRVKADTMLMSVVPVGEAYVDANFKEVQLAHVRPGQPAELTADLYGGGVVFHGQVAGLAGGTGSAFAVIPAQNATGNWIKVVQRVPVRVVLDPSELAIHPLRVGLSMNVTIDTAPTGAAGKR